MNSAFMKLNLRDVAKGLFISVVVVVLASLQEGVTAHGVEFAAYDWAGIFDLAWKAGVAYLFKNFITDTDGKLNLGVARI